MIENDLVEGSNVTPVIEIWVEQNDPVADSGMERTNELHQIDNTQIIGRIVQENSGDSIPSLRVIDMLWK